MQTIFTSHGLKVQGTAEQSALYSNDEHAYDYIKGAIEHIVKCAEKYAGKEPSARYVRYKGTNRLTFVNENPDGIPTSGYNMTDVGRRTKVFVYDSKKKEFSDEISIDDLEIMKQKNYLEYAAWDLDIPLNNAVNETLREELKQWYGDKVQAQIEDESGIKFKPQPLNDAKKELKSESGFYVGDPSLVLKDDLLNRGIRQGSQIQTGHYNVRGVEMVITPATNGSHAGHDIYSGTIGVIPLELIDKNKLKQLPMDSVDIRTGNQMNVIAKNNRLFMAQGSIDEINTAVTDEMTTQPTSGYQIGF